MKKLSIATLIFLTAAVFLWALVGPGCSGGDSNNSGGCTIGVDECKFGCDPNLGCVDCFNDGDCPNGSPFCIYGKCEQCLHNDDCADDQVCFPRESRCEDPCVDSNDCHDEHEPICDVESGICIECYDSNDCPTNAPLCDQIIGQCAKCLHNKDCPVAKPACDYAQGECQECIVDSQCPSSQICENDHKCHDACQSDADCDESGHPFCDTDRRKCIECITDDHCGVAKPICKDDGKCVGCVHHEDCSEDAPICKHEQCIQCDKDEDCKDPEFPKCVEEVCVAP